MIKYHYPAVFSMLLSLACVCHAQDEVQLQFVSFPRAAVSEPVELLIGNGKTIEVVMPTNNLSPVYEVPRLSQWALGKTETDENGLEKFEIYGTAHALNTVKQLVLVVRDGAGNADGLTLTPFDLQQGGFTGGSYLFFNAAKVDIAATVGDSKFALKPLAHRLVTPIPIKAANGRQQLHIHLFFRKDEEAIPFYSSTWRYSNKARSMVFFYHNTRGGQLRTHSIRDYLP